MNKCELGTKIISVNARWGQAKGWIKCGVSDLDVGHEFLGDADQVQSGAVVDGSLAAVADPIDEGN